MRKCTLPRHPRTGVLAVGWRRPRPGEEGPQPIWPILGGAPDDDDGDDGDQGDDKDGGDESDKDKDDDGKDWRSEAEKWKELARKHEQRAKENAAAAKELTRLKREGMSEVEKRIDEAVAAARAEERVRAGERVARSAFLAAAKGRLKNPKAVADDINLRKYVNEDGEVDDDEIAKLVDRLAPKSDTDDEDGADEQEERDTRHHRRRRSFGQGARRRNGSRTASVQDGWDLYDELLGSGKKT